MMGSVIGEKRHSEKGDSSVLMPPPNYKRRKVSAVRDFPHGCGPNALPIDTYSKLVESGEKATNISDVQRIRTHEEVVVCGSSDGVQVSKGEELDSPKDLAGGSVQLQSLPHYPVPPNLVGKERKYPPRKRVSAVRTFPAGCGRNVSKPGQTEENNVVEVETNDKINETAVPNLIGRKLDADFSRREEIQADVSGNSDNLTEMLSDSEEVAAAQMIVYTTLFGRSSEIMGRRDRIREEAEQPVYNGNNENRDTDSVPDKSNETLIGYGRKNTFKKNSIGVVGKDTELAVDSSAAVAKGKGIIVQGLMCTEQPVYNGNNENRDTHSVPDKSNETLIVYGRDNNIKKKSFGVSGEDTELAVDSRADVAKGKVINVQGLMCAALCPWRDRKGPVKASSSRSGRKVAKGKQYVYAAEKKPKGPVDKIKNSDNLVENSMMIVPYVRPMETNQISSALVLSDEEVSSENEELDDFDVTPRTRYCDVNITPSLSGSSSEKCMRSKVRDTLRLFHACVRKLIQEEAKLKDHEKSSKRADTRAAGVLRDKGKYLNTEKLVGAVPGVEIGDIFSYRAELAIIGLHSPLQSGIDSTKLDRRTVAISIVASGGYDNDVDSSDVLIYTGQGGNQTGPGKQPEDQKLERGNLALKNSIDCNIPVRVIRGFKDKKPADNPDAKPKTVTTYTYDGLYTVESCWQDVGSHGKLVYKFRLRRNPGQRELAWKEMKQSKKFNVREGLCVVDISEGKENLPICAINTIDDEKPPPFTYITSMMYPDWCRPIPPKGCDCKNGCSDSNLCACAVKNGGEIPYNQSGAIVEAKALVYECGPSCKCPPSCCNRVGQHGIKLTLEIFKTNSMGWGVRCLSAIPSGSFICEYIGELLDDKEAEQRIGSDEYLFDIGENYSNPVNSNDLSALLPDMPTTASDVVENIGFTIDAARYGNIGRFVNHSCSPNLYAQNVVYDHEDTRIPHVMLFAAENIPPLEELTYDYNYTIDQVFDSKGNIKKKSCYCGSVDCKGRLY